MSFYAAHSDSGEYTLPATQALESKTEHLNRGLRLDA
jgi:hypothetical protein